MNGRFVTTIDRCDPILLLGMKNLASNFLFSDGNELTVTVNITTKEPTGRGSTGPSALVVSHHNLHHCIASTGSLMYD